MVQLIMIVLESFNQDLNTFHEFGLLTLFVCVCLCGRGRGGGRFPGSLNGPDYLVMKSQQYKRWKIHFEQGT